MTDKFISADKLIDELQERHQLVAGTVRAIVYGSVIATVRNFPPADVVEVKHAEWIHIDETLGFYECSECGFVYEEDYDFCPHCGCRMIGDDINNG